MGDQFPLRAYMPMQAYILYIRTVSAFEHWLKREISSQHWYTFYEHWASLHVHTMHAAGYDTQNFHMHAYLYLIRQVTSSFMVSYPSHDFTRFTLNQLQPKTALGAVIVTCVMISSTTLFVPVKWHSVKIPTERNYKQKKYMVD